MAGMNKTKIKKFKKILQDRLTELLKDFGEAARNISEHDREQFADPTDQAVSELDRSRYLRFKDRERKHMRKIEQAIERIDEGTYGECETCGVLIEEARLEARPMAELCIGCATEAEGEKQRKRLHNTKSSSAASLMT